MKKELIVHKNPKSPNSEIFRTLRTNIQFMNTNKKMKTLLVTSTFPGEGKSWVAANLAVTFAQAGKKVVLIDADMRKGRQYKIFDIAAMPGLSNCLSEAEINEYGEGRVHSRNYVQETEIENLYIMAAGSVPPNPSELLVSAQMSSLLDDLKTMFDLVIIDGTPCELVTDSIILSRIVDCTVLVAAHKMTKKDALERVIKTIQNVGGNLAGVVLNRVPVSKKYNQQYYYYGSRRMNKKENQKNFAKIDDSKLKKQDNTKTNMKIEEHESITNHESINNNENEKTTNTDSPSEFLGKTNEILKQINDYIDAEKMKLNEKE